MFYRKGKLGISWYSEFTFKNQRFKKSHGAVSKTLAKQKDILFKRQVISGEYDKLKKEILFENLVPRYLDYSKLNKRPKSYERDVSSFKNLEPFFEGKSLNEINAFLVERYKKERLKKVKPITINTELDALKSLLKMAVEWKQIITSPVKVKMFKCEKEDVEILTPEREDELLNLLSDRSGTILLVSLNTSMRKSEILDLTKENIDLENRMIHVTHTKNREVRDIPINEKLIKVLRDFINKSSKSQAYLKSPYVFATRTGKRVPDITVRKESIKIGMKGFKFHHARHTWCSRMCEKGVAESTIMELSGWKTRSMINRYAHPSMEHKRESLEKLCESQNEVPPKITLKKSVALQSLASQDIDG